VARGSWEINFKGGDAVDKALSELPAKLQANILRGATREAAVVFAEAVRERAHSAEARGSVKVGSTRVMPDGTIRGTVQAKGKGSYIALWEEWGTAAHFISVKDDIRPTTKTRRGVRVWGIGTINKAVRRGSLVIGKNYVGASVFHPGAAAHPFFRPGFDAGATDALRAYGSYVSTRLSKEGLSAPGFQIGDDGE